jgi:hypothetical protein
LLRLQRNVEILSLFEIRRMARGYFRWMGFSEADGKATAEGADIRSKVVTTRPEVAFHLGYFGLVCFYWRVAENEH